VLLSSVAMKLLLHLKTHAMVHLTMKRIGKPLSQGMSHAMRCRYVQWEVLVLPPTVLGRESYVLLAPLSMVMSS